jgi:hypothetical protein
MRQELLFELNGARVTPHIATFGGTSYQISNIGTRHATQKVQSVGCHHLSSWAGYSGCRDSQIPHDGTGGRVFNGCNWDRHRDRIHSASTYLAAARVCTGFENIEW